MSVYQCNWDFVPYSKCCQVGWNHWEKHNHFVYDSLITKRKMTSYLPQPWTVLLICWYFLLYYMYVVQQMEKRKFRSWESGNGQSCTFLLCSGFPRPGCNIRACVMRHNCSINTFKCKRYEPNEKGVTLVGSNKIKETLEKPVERSIRFTPLPCDQTLTSKHRPKTWDGRLLRLWFEVMAFTFTWMHLADACI